MNLRRAILCLITVVSLVAPAQCEFFYNLRFDQTDLLLNSGSTATLNIYFEETVTGGSVHRLDLGGGTNGLIDGSFHALLSGAGNTTVTGRTGNAGFDFQDLGLPGAVTVFTQATVANGPVFGTDVVSGTRRVQLGTITVTAGNEGAVNVLTLDDHSVNEITIDNGFGVPPLFLANSVLSFGSVNINVSAVPEPSLGLLGLATAGGAAWWRRRRRDK